VLASAVPVSTASMARFRAAGSKGGTSGLGNCAKASPQYAIAQVGSVRVTRVKVFTVSG
jgi:hypothetical protein